MRRFRFRLDGLLRLRSQLERNARATLAAAMGTVAGVEQRLAAAGEGLRQCEEHARGADAAGKLARALETGLARYRWRLQAELRAASAQLERARGEWLDSRRQRRTLLQLREHRRGAWLLLEGRREQRELEELSRLRAPGDAGAAPRGGTA